MPESAFPVATSRTELETGSVLAPRFDEHGLIAAIAQHATTGEILMLAWMNAEALAQTLSLGEAVYYSRSRREIWHKGATSGQIQTVVELRMDCDQDAILLKVLPQGDGGACHVGHRACFFRRIGPDGRLETLPDS